MLFCEEYYRKPSELAFNVPTEAKGVAYVDAPKLLHGIERDNFFEQVVPVFALSTPSVSRLLLTLSGASVGAPMKPHLATRRLREPQRPRIHQRMLDIEILRIMEDGDFLRLLVFLLG